MLAYFYYFVNMNKIKLYEQIPQESRADKSIRLKITKNCPWECQFCHEEGGGDIDAIKWDETAKKNILLMKEKLGIEEIHLTGGEPTSNKDIEEIALGLSMLGLDVKMTTNGQFKEDRLKRMYENGIKEFNFSVHALNPDDFIEAQRNKDLSWAKNNIETQKKIIKKALELGVKIKLNTIISEDRDIGKTLEVIKFAKENGISSIRILGDLYNGEKSIKAISKFIGLLKAEKFKEVISVGSSNKTSFYKCEDGFEFAVKEINDFKLNTLCDDCKEKCLEKFYGIRLEQKDGKFYVRLCIGRKDGKSFMPLEEFFESDQFKEINKLLNE